MDRFLEALPVAASSPLALVAYALTLSAFVIIQIRSARTKELLRKIDKVPPKERAIVLQAEMNIVLPRDISAEEWIRARRNSQVAALVGTALVCLTLVAVIAFDRASEPAADVHKPDGTGPEFADPRIDGRTIDACIASALFPEQRKMQCIRSAKLEIATAFCRAAGYGRVSTFETKQTGVYQSSYKLHKNIAPGGRLVEDWLEDNTGGSIFTRISCA